MNKCGFMPKQLTKKIKNKKKSYVNSGVIFWATEREKPRKKKRRRRRRGVSVLSHRKIIGWQNSVRFRPILSGKSLQEAPVI